MKIYFIFLVSLFFSFKVSAAVVLNGTRIIYPEDAKEVTINATNQGDRPFAVQAWVDLEGVETNPNTPGEMRAPFFVTPVIAKIAPNAGQSLRIIFTGASLPSDRESIFYFNLLQIPPVPVMSAGANVFQVLVKDRLKLFYRPSSVVGKPIDVKDKLEFSLLKKDGFFFIKAVNPTGYYASLVGAKIKSGEESLSVSASMLPPFSEDIWEVSEKNFDPAGAEFSVKLVNDYGGLMVITTQL